MRFRPSARAVSITIGYIILLAALAVIRLGRQHLPAVRPPADSRLRGVTQRVPGPAPAAIAKPAATSKPIKPLKQRGASAS
jgi:hypothetical protein